MIRRPAPIKHVKHVRSRGKWYAYFNTGRKRDGKPIYVSLPDPASTGFWDSYSGFMGARTKRAATAYTVEQLVEEYLGSTEYAGKADATRRLYKIQLAKVTNLLGEFPVDDLQGSDIRDAIDAEKYAPGTRNSFVAVIAALYKWARKRGKTTLRPTSDIERLKMGEHDPWPDNVLSVALEATDDRIRLAVHLLYYTGQRIGDVCAMGWNDIRGDVIHVRQSKTGKDMVIPLHTNLAAELKQAPKRGITILTDETGRGLSAQRLRRELQAHTADAGTPTVPHGLRKNAVNTLLLSGCTIAEVASITGQTHQMVEHYAKKIDQRRIGQAAMLKFERGTKSEEESAGKTGSSSGGK